MADIDKLEAKIEMMGNALDNLSSKVSSLTDKIIEMDKKVVAMEDKLERDYKLLYGNGHPGLAERVSHIEEWTKLHEQAVGGSAIVDRVATLEKKMLVQEQVAQSKGRMIDKWIAWAFAAINVAVLAWKC